MTSGPEHPLIRRLVDTGKLEYLLRGAGIFLRDYSSGIGFSNTFWRECGYGELEMGWEEWVEFVHPQDKFRIVDAVRKLQEGKGDFFTEEYRIRDRRGRYRWVRSRALVLERAPDGMPSLYLGMDLEITDLMNRLESERAVREELEQRYHEAEVLRKATMEATASADPEEAIGRILARSRGIVSADVVLIWAVTEDGLECLGAIGSDRFPPVPRDRLPKIIAWVLEERRPRRNLTRPVRRGGNIFRDSLYMPVVSRGRVLGVLEFLGRGARALGHRAEGPAALFADSVAVVLESALALRELDQEASLDWLTNLSTRRRFDFRARAYLEGAAENATFCALMIDLDRFKVVNDTFGHAAGDRALAAAAGVCRDAL
ncbi:MAG TPA: PAS domain-containing protein, partial [Magnetospirillaceae bacterium]|nr:PAS domain-containing protein [Magnetospirillaceae bacterium]